MSDAPAAPVPENGVPPVTQDKPEEAPGFKVFAGNLAYSTTDEGLKAFFAPVQSDMYVATHLHSLHQLLISFPSSLSTQVILRGTRSAGYGFVALATAEAAQKAVEALDKKELDGRQVIVEVAKPSEQKDKEKKEKKAKRRPGRRGSKAVPGEISEAEASGEPAPADDAAEAAPGSDEAAKPKKKKKKAARKPKVKAEGEASDPGAVTETDAAATTTEAAAKKAPRARKPKAPRTPRPAGEDPVGEPSKTVLFVANLGFNIDDAGLAGLFTEAGITVNSARIVRRRWGQPRKSKGYGFVDVGGEDEQQKAIKALEGKDVGGRAIAVKVAVNAPHDEETADEKPETTEAAALVAAAT
ncbi:hypothetical protein DXG03_000009 [Asterophora parasitica]|uniref:RRM domain-containing protein n=1 Tax=Asterophora parasitica TaxID=117018 RepID=A0A9P7GHG1_9AGAR|nr:hypothetical protein DXG03_000009 [Asterophora parasitica]